MRRIIETIVEYPVYANLIILTVVLAGVLSFMSMKKAYFPEIESRMINVSVYYPGASPIEMEEGVTSRIEEAVRGIIGIKEINSTTVENRSMVSIETTGEYSMNEVLMEVKNAVDGISSLPSAAERPIVSKSRSRAPALRISIVPKDGYDFDLMTLKQHAQRIEEDFYSSGVMSQISISGFPQPEISVEIMEEELLRYNLTFNNIVRAIQNNNQDVSGGEIKSEDEELLIRLRSRSADPNKIGNIILVGQPDGSYIRIRDVAEVKTKFADSPEGIWTNGKPTVAIRVEKLPEEDLDEITEFANDYIEKFNNRNQGVEIIVTRAYLDILKTRLQFMTRNGVLGLILVIVSLSMFLSIRLSLWVSWGIPFSFLGMFILARLLGVTINMMSLFGMILVIGILVDSGIVIAENIYQYFERGWSPMKASVEGTLEVFPAVLTSVTTTIIAFAPLLFLSGTRMEMMYDVAIVVIAVLFFSLIEAFMILPAFLSNERVLSRKSLETKKKGLQKYFHGFIIWLRDDIYHYMLEWLLKWRHVVIGIPIALFMITMGLFLGGHIKNTFFPMVDYDSFEVNIAFNPGDGEKQTLEFLERFEKAVWEVNEEMTKELGLDVNLIERTNKELGSAFDHQESGAHAGSIDVYPIDLEGLPVSGRDISDRVRRKIGPVPEARKFTVAGRNRWGAPVSVGLMSLNLQELNEAKEYLIKRLDEMPQLKDVTENIALGKQEVRLILKPKAYFLGLDENEIAGQVRQGFYGAQAQRLQVGRDELRVWVRYPKSGRLTLGQMEKMKIKTPQGEYPLNELSDYQLERGPVAINRFNGSREIRVEAETIDPFAAVPEILDQIDRDIMPDLLSQYSGIRYMYQGQQKSSREALKKAYRLFSIAFLFIIILLMVHFKSAQQTFMVILMIPISMLGVAWGHGLHNQPLSIMSLWGMVALAGVVINNAIVFIAKYDGLLVDGLNVHDAIVEAGKVRLRPIILTTITTVLGLFPVIFQKSIQAQFLIPMAISLAYGVAIGTIFILIFLPVLIMLFNDFRVYTKYLWTGKKPEREDVEVAIILHKRKMSYEENGIKKKSGRNMMHYKRLILIIYSLALTSALNAQSDTLTTSGAIVRALDNNYGIIISRTDLDVAVINNSWGEAGRYPAIGFEASANNNYNSNSENLTNRISAGIGLDWLIFDGFRVNITKERLDNIETASAGALAVTIESTVEDIIMGYYGVLLDKERLGVLETVMNLSKDRYDYELARQKLGGSVTYNVLQAQNVYLNDKTNFMNQEVILRNSVRNLNFLMGEDPAVTWYFTEVFSADTSMYSLGDLISKMESSNQVLRNQYTNLILRQNETELNRSSYYPTLSFSTGVDNIYTNTYNNTSGSSHENQLSPYGNIRLSYDIFAAGSRKRSMEIARINEASARVEIERMEHLLTNELFNLYDYYGVRIALLNLSNEGLIAAELNMSIAEEKYRSGAITSFEYRDIQLIYLNAALQRLQAIYNLIESRTRLTRITGGFLNTPGND